VRTFLAYSLLLLLLAGFAGFAWLTRHPETPWLAEAEGWPLVGPLAARFREAWLPPELRHGAGEEGGREDGAGNPARRSGAAGLGAGGEEGEEEPEIIVLSPGFLHGAREMVWLVPGMVLRSEPGDSAPVLLEPGGVTNVPVVERRGDWVQVVYRRRAGWVKSPQEWVPPLPAEPLPVHPVPALAPDPARLALAREILHLTAEEPSGRLGPYPLYTDHPGVELYAFLDRVAAETEAAYVERYGRTPLGEAAEAIVLFTRQEDYRSFQASEARIAGIASAGHAAGGILALYAEGEHRLDLASTLVHEIVHLLNRRALGPALPPWLDEGLAGDLGAATFTPEGKLLTRELGGRIELSPGRIDYHGSHAALRRLHQALDRGDAPTLEEMVDLSWEDFVHPSLAELNYAESAFFLRYLIAGEGGAMAPGFRAFLAAVSEGEPPTGEALRTHLDRPWSRIEPSFQAWVRAADELQEPVRLGR